MRYLWWAARHGGGERGGTVSSLGDFVAAADSVIGRVSFRGAERQGAWCLRLLEKAMGGGYFIWVSLQDSTDPKG